LDIELCHPAGPQINLSLAHSDFPMSDETPITKSPKAQSQASVFFMMFSFGIEDDYRKAQIAKPVSGRPNFRG